MAARSGHPQPPERCRSPSIDAPTGDGEEPDQQISIATAARLRRGLGGRGSLSRRKSGLSHTPSPSLANMERRYARIGTKLKKLCYSSS